VGVRNRSQVISDDARSRQRNTVWPDTLRNGRFVDVFLWRGSPDATLVQRIGTTLFGLLFCCPAVVLLRFGFFEPGPAPFRMFMLLLALPWLAFGCKLLHNAFRH
jgi:hypothetical protein